MAMRTGVWAIALAVALAACGNSTAAAGGGSDDATGDVKCEVDPSYDNCYCPGQGYQFYECVNNQLVCPPCDGQGSGDADAQPDISDTVDSDGCSQDDWNDANGSDGCMCGFGNSQLICVNGVITCDCDAPSSDDSDTIDAAGCKEGSTDLSFDNCYCPGNPVPGFPVCTKGKYVCPPCPGPDATGSDTADATTIDASPDVADIATADVPAAPYSAVQAVFDARCTNCHSATALGLPGYAKLPLTSDVSYKTLVNSPASEPCGGTLVVPGQPDQSYLWLKLTATTPCYGSHMPAKFEVMPAPPLTADQLAAIHDWIAGGALP